MRGCSAIGRELKGYLLIISATLLWGLCGALSKHFFNQSLSPLVLVDVRLTLSALLLLVWLCCFCPGALRFAPGDRKRLVIFSWLGLAGMQCFYLFTVSRLNVAGAVFLLSLAPVPVALYQTAFEGKPLTCRDITALLAACAGSALILSHQNQTGGTQTVSGIATGLASALAYAFYNIYGKPLLVRNNPWGVLGFSLLTGAIPFWLLVPPWAWAIPVQTSWQVWLFFFYISLFATILPFGLSLKGLSHLEPYQASIAGTMEPVMASLFAFLLLGETLCGWQLLGCCLVLAGVVSLQLPT